MAGVVADAHGWRTAVIVGAAASTVGAAVSLTRRRTLV
jgi:hypothetical protein